MSWLYWSTFIVGPRPFIPSMKAEIISWMPASLTYTSNIHPYTFRHHKTFTWIPIIFITRITIFHMHYRSTHYLASLTFSPYFSSCIPLLCLNHMAAFSIIQFCWHAIHSACNTCPFCYHPLVLCHSAASTVIRTLPGIRWTIYKLQWH